MHKIPLRDLEGARRDPGSYRARLDSPTTSGPRFGYFAALRLAAIRFHKVNSLSETLEYHAALTDRFADRRRVLADTSDLEWYVEHWNDPPGTPFALKRRIRAPVGEVFKDEVVCSGEVPRLDLVPSGGYRAWLFRPRQVSDWKEELQMPLIQLAVAAEMGVPPVDVSVGVYSFALRRFETTSFSVERRRAARVQLQTLLMTLGFGH
jgi:hypothetical protein